MFRWYVVNTYSGHENKVKANLEHRIESMGQRPRFRRVVVPTEQVIETKDGQKVQAEKRVLPGYVLVNMDLNDDAWTVVKNTPGVTGFVGAGSKPVPLSKPEVDRILHTGAGGGAPTRAQVEITVFEDRSFSFITKTPPAAVLIKEALRIEKGSAEPNRTKVGRLSRDQVRSIAEAKLQDLNARDVDHAALIIAGTARSMGVEVDL